MHPLIAPDGFYEPSKSSKKRWLFTRKRYLSFGDLILPGFYQTYNFKVDRFLFFLVIALELYGLYVLWNTLPQPWIALVVFGADLFCAIFSHLLKAKLLIAKTKMKLAKASNKTFTPGKNAKYEEDRQRYLIYLYKAYEIFWYILIALLALAKVLSIFSYKANLVLGFKVFLTLVYVSIAYIHIFHTGYFIAELWFQWWIKKEKKVVDHARQEDYPNIRDAIVTFRHQPLEKKFKKVSVYKQEIKDDKSEGSLLYNWGVLQDDELIFLAEAQEKDEETKKLISLELLYFQYGLSQQNAYRENIAK